MAQTRRQNHNQLIGCAVLLAALSACAIDDPLSPHVSATRVPPSASAATATSFGFCDYDQNEQSLTSAGWSKVFYDDFFGALSQWTVWYGGAFNNELELYQAANLSVDPEGGFLSIIARHETVTGPTNPWDATPKTFTYTSGRIESTASFSANKTTPRVRMSARIKLPAGYGMWPAFWSYGDPWPTQGEIDTMEGRGNEPFQYQTNYFYGRRANVNLVQNASSVISSSSSLTDCFHVYEVIWEKNTLTFLLDNTVVDTKSGGYIPNIFGKKERAVLNLAVGGNFFANLDPSFIQPGTMVVDWVRVFTAH